MSEFDGWRRALDVGTFEDAFAALEAVVVYLEEGRLPLAESVACYELGVQLSEHCERILDAAELRVSQLERAADRMESDAEAADLVDPLPF